MEIIYGLDELEQVAARLIADTENNILLFIGEMGVGKTTLIKEIVKQLGSNDRVSSPTFSLVNEYITSSGPIYHFDFYRIENEEEAYDIGFEEYVYSPFWKLIEWPQKIQHLLPTEHTQIDFSVLSNGKRKILIG